MIKVVRKKQDVHTTLPRKLKKKKKKGLKGYIQKVR